MPRIRPVLAALLLSYAMLPTAGAAPLPAAPAYAEIKDWVIGCDNTRACEARGFSQEHLGMEMFITRAAGPKASALVTFKADIPIDIRKLAMDGAPLHLAGDGVTTRTLDFDNPGSTIMALSPAASTGLLAAIRNGNAISFGPPQSRNGEGDSDPTVSLKGLAAILLLMDDVQGRLDTETALMRKGAGAASTVPPAPDPPMPPSPATAGKPPAEATARAIIKTMRSSPVLVEEDCDTTLDQPQDAAFALGTNQTLVLVECLRGAYQSSDLAFRLDGTNTRTARLLALSLPLHKDPVRLFGNAAYDPKSATLSTADRGRGPNDCGDTAAWIFDGKDFILTDYARQDACGGVESGDWPVLWRMAKR